MKHILISLFALFLTFGFAVDHAEAKRFGGGKSFGMQRTAPTKQTAAPAPQQQGAAPTAAPKKNSWMGPIAGLAAGLGLAALFSHLGMGEGMANFMMMALLAMAAFMLFRWLMRRNAPAAPAMQYAGMPHSAPVAFDQTPAALGSSIAPAPAASRPASMQMLSRVKPNSTSSACRLRLTPTIWMMCVPSLRPKFSPKSACSWPNVAMPNRRPM